MTRSGAFRYGAAGLLVVVLAVLPFLHRSVGGLLPGPINSPGSLQVLALMLVAAAAAITLDLMFGYTGLMSFGHSLYVGFGCYATVILSNNPKLGFTLGVPLAMVLSVVVALVGNAAALRLTGIGFSMATLAMAQGFAIAVERGFLGSGGEVGVTFARGVLPDPLRGVLNTRNVYWLALALVVVVYVICALLVRTHVGHVWQGIRENPLRTKVIGYNVYAYQMAAATISCTLAAMCGVVFAIVMGGANPGIAGLHYSLAVVLMVVLGGRGVLWGAALGAVLYQFLNLRLPSLSSSDIVTGLPEILQIPLSQPNFLLGVAFILIILFMPGGLASIFTRLTRRATSKRAGEPKDDDGGMPAPTREPNLVS
ncbi:branched-chain amino acid ABC transporter permease [Acrocarpospora sp. B8E8]|uniref:branched-chain amino acid ABC transporter permease n=1 Tax=Acrocarpospora sp. B8E8 TaxID=3153572 RepID=UPI00325CE8C1